MDHDKRQGQASLLLLSALSIFVLLVVLIYMIYSYTVDITRMVLEAAAALEAVIFDSCITLSTMLLLQMLLA